MLDKNVGILFSGAEGIQSTQVLRPEKIVYTDNCMKRDNWQMVVCNDTYGKVCVCNMILLW